MKVHYPRRGVYLLPNLFTTASLFAAFYAIVASVHGHFRVAAIAIFIAMILDGLDGRVARMTGTQSAFGAEYDSLADVIAFGVAPALLVLLWGLQDYGKFGWLGAFVYTACGALRLARFNSQVHSASKRYFQGLPIPTAAAVLTSLVWVAVGERHPWLTRVAEVLALVLVYLLALLMVSNIRYRSFKDFDLHGRVPFALAIGFVLILALIAIHPPLVLFGAALLFTLSGPLLTLWQMRQHRLLRRRHGGR
ncbi:CDP-diacylglycerol--serine O-phosphatidyltransferase [Acidithiobacillus caldus]|uniref:CDP-diacylglycerol--serine O-phosphatidyltransferase n=1 Tax=Acidithiobacillus caldus TaxID=33059 RepID=A0A1E7YJB7_9PROT|nr:CDP-diacylglycerol--serine O-phosphatidyltransferase [Acidithiobacillus caldus]MCE5419307.1 CDP-diacylglycerol--serine O-phosphatidyltransferase [Acidithiobacillus sp.]MBU2761997.1 CDP-diacylglycerol--serine O-phosphatidyltransferase [Acidithiobacillus caldus]MBU2771291.1 CDP-diacylglycerol--serine O-phosphatidyltransferase [Acidithiobacillus caldus]OFC29541.1 CDP-diacylglycerol--serine O-phosphatidyltransferase [Acidithiobacillus caldus]OFC30011.1 CDP-diacylglycerol--serine O-phosphatidylt